MFNLIIEPEAIDHEVRAFEHAASPDYLEEAMDWVGTRQRVAVLQPTDAPACVLLPVSLFHSFEDVSLAKSYLPHWELDGFAVEDMPTVRDILIGSEDGLLLQCVREVLSNALSPSGDPDVSGACDYMHRMLSVIRGFKFNSCDSNPIIVFPRYRYRVTNSGQTEMEVQTVAYSIDDVRAESTDGRNRLGRYWWHDVLGYKAWFGGVSIHDEYRALAWLLCKMQKDGLVDYGIWMGARPATEQEDPSIHELNKASGDELKSRMRAFADRTCSLSDLITMTFEVEQNLYDEFLSACLKKGLSVQNGVHILLRRAIAYLTESKKCDFHEAES